MSSSGDYFSSLLSLPVVSSGCRYRCGDPSLYERQQRLDTLRVALADIGEKLQVLERTLRNLHKAAICKSSLADSDRSLISLVQNDAKSLLQRRSAIITQIIAVREPALEVSCSSHAIVDENVPPGQISRWPTACSNKSLSAAAAPFVPLQFRPLN